ncbi:MAG: hypothetical protein Q8O87_04235 [bacterium]|nr:hypothetical protein [bacterium]
MNRQAKKFFAELREEKRAREVAKKMAAKKLSADIAALGLLPGNWEIFDGKTVVRVNEGAVYSRLDDSIAEATESAKILAEGGAETMVVRVETRMINGVEFLNAEKKDFGGVKLAVKKCVFTDARGIVIPPASALARIYSSSFAYANEDDEKAATGKVVAGTGTGTGTYVSEESFGEPFECETRSPQERLFAHLRANKIPGPSPEKIFAAEKKNLRRRAEESALSCALSSALRGAVEIPPPPENVWMRAHPNANLPAATKVATFQDRVRAARARKKLQEKIPVRPAAAGSAEKIAEYQKEIALLEPTLSALRAEVSALWAGRGKGLTKVGGKIVAVEAAVESLKEKARAVRTELRWAREALAELQG